ncbi:CAP-associated domain-containing protein, partial [Bacillus sp. WP8]|uniref:CAP-associated domain-containing protein n=1 Tax=Bacillus sp. WP8 TaxID=756828 RepID=UPI0037C026C7
MQVPVKRTELLTFFPTADPLNLQPFKIPQPTTQLFNKTQIPPYIHVHHEQNSYPFQFSQHHINTRPTLKVGDHLYVQLYIDKFESTLST